MPSKLRSLLGGKGIVSALKIFAFHAFRLHAGFFVDRLVQRHRPFLVQHSFGCGMGERGTVCELDSEVARARLQHLRLAELVVKAPIVGLAPGQRATGVEQLGGAAQTDDARQHRAGTHVGARETDAHEQKRDARSIRAQAQIAHHCEYRAGAGAHAVDRRDDRLRTGEHGFDEIAGHLGEGEEFGRSALRQRTDDFVDVAARTEVIFRAGQHDRLDVRLVIERTKEVAQLGVQLESERILPLGPLQRDGHHAIGDLDARALHRMRNGKSSSYSSPALLRAMTRSR